MSPQFTIAELSRMLLDTAEAALLDLPLYAVAARESGEDTRALLAALGEATAAQSLREVLQDNRLARWVDATCTERETWSIRCLLRAWLGIPELGEIGADDPARLSEVLRIPKDPEAVVRWARDHRVVGELIRPLVEVLPEGACCGPQLSLLEACCGDFSACDDDAISPGATKTFARGARSYLQREAAEALAASARDSLWRRPWPQGVLAPLGPRLHDLTAGFSSDNIAILRFLPSRPVAVNPSTGECRGVLGAPACIEVSLQLAGFEVHGVVGVCDTCSVPSCIHVAALAARLIDACLEPQDRLHAPLEAYARVPSWQRFLDEVMPPPPQAVAASALVFELRVVAEIVEVGVLTAPLGTSVRHKLVAPWRALRSKVRQERDRAPLEEMARRARTRGPEIVPADVALLRALVDHPGLRDATRGGSLRLREKRVHVELAEQPGGAIPRVTLAGGRVTARARSAYVVHADAATNTLTFALLPPALHQLLAALEHFRGVLPPESYPMLARWLAALREHADVSVPAAVGGDELPPPNKLLLRIHPRLHRFGVDGDTQVDKRNADGAVDEGVYVALCVRVFPLSPVWLPGEGEEREYGLLEGKAVTCRRNFEREREIAAHVREVLELGEIKRPDSIYYEISSDVAALELLSRAARLGDYVDIEWADQPRRIRCVHTVQQSDLFIQVLKVGGWLKIGGGARFGDAEIAMHRLLQLAHDGHRFVRVSGRDYVEIEQSLFDRLNEAKQVLPFTLGELRIILAAAPALIEQLGDRITAADAPTGEWLERLKAPLDEAPALDPTLDAVLRPYQRDGARWLLQCSGWAPGACLADEMGLGKTVQAIAVLLYRAAEGPALVVAPTSLIENWLGELARFAPSLQAAAYRGSERGELLATLGPGSVLVSSYDIVLRDCAILAEHRFATQVIDEAQNVRNARTRRARSLAEVPAEFRIALSGTPIENRLGDLWSLFQLIAPGLLGTWRRFRALFGVPIDRHEDSQRAARLRALVGPLMLRRTKTQVAPELPARIETVQRVALAAAEQTLYRAAVGRARLALRQSKKEKAEGRKREITIHVLAELTRLRQLACHPRLVIPDERIESSKLHALLRLLDDILPRGHRVLVFSQFTTLLTLVSEALARRGIRWLYLDGAVPGAERGRLVERFQAGEAEVFLISLKAGGTGLNLTAADYVVHMDPWWNPAAQNQASDRAHRIGQVRPVTIVKLVAEGTIEERVLELHAHKQWLADSVLAEGGVSGEVDFEMMEALLAE